MLAKNQQIILAMVSARYETLRQGELAKYRAAQEEIFEKLTATPEYESAHKAFEALNGANGANVALGYDRYKNQFPGGAGTLTTGTPSIEKSSWAFRWLDSQGFDPNLKNFTMKQFIATPVANELTLALATVADSWAKIQDPMINLGYDLSLCAVISDIETAVITFLKAIK